MAIQQKLYTADDLWEISHSESGKRYELYEGDLLEMSPTGYIHGIFTAWLLHLIMTFVEEHDLGEVTGAETGYILFTDPYTIAAPDVAFMSKARLVPMTGKYHPTPPDMAVEVVSPSDRAADVEKKAIKYLEAGTKLVWVVYPDDRVVYVYRPDHDIIIAKDAAVLDGYDVLPGFNLSIVEVFKKLR